MNMSEFSVLNIQEASDLPGVLLWNAAKLWQKHVYIAVAPLGLSSTNAVILVNLLHLLLEKKRISQAAVAELSNVDIMTTSNALRTLENKGLVVRTPDATDRRFNILTLTPIGHETAIKALHLIAMAHQRFFNVIASDQTKLSELLSRLLQAHTPVETTPEKHSHEHNNKETL